MTLAEFVLARIAEDEAAVRAATAPGEMHPWGDTDLPETSIESFPYEVRGYLGGTWGEHCARWSFTRVLAECEAKRRIVELHQGAENARAIITAIAEPEPIAKGIILTTEATTGTVLAYLALPYADHPDYDEDWRP